MKLFSFRKPVACATCLIGRCVRSSNSVARWRRTSFFSACSDDASDPLEGTVVEDGLGCSVLEVDRQTTAPEVAATDPVEELVKKDLKAAGEKACKAESQPYLTLDMVGGIF